MEELIEKHYTAWVVDEWMSTEQWWDNSEQGKWKYSVTKTVQCLNSTTNSTQNGLGLIQGFHDELPLVLDNI